MKKIIAFLPSYVPSSGELAHTQKIRQLDIDMIREACQGKSTALVYTPFTYKMIFEKMKLAKRLSIEGDLHGLDQEVQNLLENIEKTNRISTNAYSEMIWGTSMACKIIDTWKNIILATEYEILTLKKSLMSLRPRHIDISLYREVAQYIQLFERARHIYKEIQDRGSEVVVMDFETAHCLHWLHPDEFEIVNDAPPVLVEQMIYDLHRQFSDYQIFNAWDMEKSKLFLLGAHNLENIACSTFELFSMEPLERGRIKGIMWDRNGLSVFRGRLGKTQISFIKRYLRGAQLAGTIIPVTGDPVWYRIDFPTRDGYYSPKTKKGQKKEYIRCMINHEIHPVHFSAKVQTV